MSEPADSRDHRLVGRAHCDDHVVVTDAKGGKTEADAAPVPVPAVTVGCRRVVVDGNADAVRPSVLLARQCIIGRKIGQRQIRHRSSRIFTRACKFPRQRDREEERDCGFSGFQSPVWTLESASLAPLRSAQCCDSSFSVPCARAATGWTTVNGKKLSSSQAQLGQATCLAVT